MADINSYANKLLLEFLDAFHVQLADTLREQFGDEWVRLGVERHLAKGYFDRVREMLGSPMRIVDMGKDDEELYGVEHLANIVDGNWSLFKDYFGDRARAKVYMNEVAEVRHNVSHMRKRHYLRREELLRFVQNARILLEAMRSPAAGRFGVAVDQLVSGGSPWGGALPGGLPPQDEIVDEFVGRPNELQRLGEWLVSDRSQFLLWGYGGAGKSAVAYEFAREIQEASPSEFQAVCWVTAKRIEFVGGSARERQADFADLKSFCSAVWSALYGADLAASPDTPDAVVRELGDTRILLVVDDFDTVLDDEELAEFLLFGLRSSGSKILYTSRQQFPGLRSMEIPAFSEADLREFVRLRAAEYELNVDACIDRLRGIQSVTGGYPLFVDDLLRYARVDGLQSALEHWSQRNGDAAREYALRRQLERLGRGGLDVLLAIAVADRPLRVVEVASMAGLTDDDVDQALLVLLSWRLVNRVAAEDEASPGFSMNSNTRRLVLKTYSGDARLSGCVQAYRTLSGERVPEAKRAAIGSAIAEARSMLARDGDAERSASYLKSIMIGELADSPDLYGALGWVYSRSMQYTEEARGAFQNSHRLGAQKEDTYYHWAAMERELAENFVGTLDDSELISMWRKCAEILEWGVERVGGSDAICHLLGYVRSREAKALQRQNEFIAAQSSFAQSAEWFRRALTAPRSNVREPGRGSIYRGLLISLEGLEDVPGLAGVIGEWAAFAHGLDQFYTEKDRVVVKFPQLRQLLPANLQ